MSRKQMLICLIVINIIAPIRAQNITAAQPFKNQATTCHPGDVICLGDYHYAICNGQTNSFGSPMTCGNFSGCSVTAVNSPQQNGQNFLINCPNIPFCINRNNQRYCASSPIFDPTNSANYQKILQDISAYNNSNNINTNTNANTNANNPTSVATDINVNLVVVSQTSTVASTSSRELTLASPETEPSSTVQVTVPVDTTIIPVTLTTATGHGNRSRALYSDQNYIISLVLLVTPFVVYFL